MPSHLMSQRSCLQLWLRVPRRADCVAGVRRLLDSALRVIGVTERCRYDIVLAVSEACNNVVDHALAVREYDVVLLVDHDRCSMEVADRGTAAADVSLNGHGPAATAERGRGLHLIRTVTDGVQLRKVMPHGLAVRMTKKLEWASGAPAAWPDRQYEHWAVLAS